MTQIESSTYTDRLLARFVIEAKTPLSIGNGQKDIMTDALVATDVNGLPYLPASSISGVIRSMLGVGSKDSLWGYQDKESGHGSEISFTEGKILNSEGTVMDGLINNAFDDTLLQYYKTLPIRQHVSITDKGTVRKFGKFDEQIVYAGTRFCFEIEIVTEKDSTDSMRCLIDAVRNRALRIGGGTRSGFGEIGVVSVQTCRLELDTPEKLRQYLNKPSNLETARQWWKEMAVTDGSPLESAGTTTYTLNISPIDFFLFGSGYSDEEGNADITSVKASRVDWSSDRGSMQTEQTLIPATSVKGALRHRVTFHYNRLNRKWAASKKDVKTILNEKSEVDELFGYMSNDTGTTTPGRVFFSDVIESKSCQKLLNHVSIDRFTGGAIDGALFTELVDYAPDKNFEINIRVDGALEGTLKAAFEAALDDICQGRLPLGGGVNRGNGVFTGTYTLKEY